jgi:hypothetical protein
MQHVTCIIVRCILSIKLVSPSHTQHSTYMILYTDSLYSGHTSCNTTSIPARSFLAFNVATSTFLHLLATMASVAILFLLKSLLQHSLFQLISTHLNCCNATSPLTVATLSLSAYPIFTALTLIVATPRLPSLLQHSLSAYLIFTALA